MGKLMTTLKKGFTIIEGDIATPTGFEAGGLHAGIRKKKLDLAWLYSDVPAVASGVYTLNSFQAAPLKITQENIKIDGKIQALVVNSGVANACTGEQGDKDAVKMRDLMSEQFGVLKHHVAVASTGVIGELLPMDKIEAGINKMNRQTQTSDMFETAILTTDTKEKRAAVQIEIEGKTVTIAGAAKGSGMINPNMATMLSFITTDANIEKEALDQSLKAITNQSFNMITVDGDTSTNDMVLVLANGKQQHTPLTAEHTDYALFEEALTYVCQTLAKEIARDGEGATKLIEVHVTGTAHDESAQKIGKAVISSNLVKTAIHGADANWGRIITAVGYSGEPIDPNQVSVKLGEMMVVNHGVPVVFSEDAAKQYLQQTDVTIDVSVGEGPGEAYGWGCDLSYDYVRINASYRT